LGLQPDFKQEFTEFLRRPTVLYNIALANILITPTNLNPILDLLAVPSMKRKWWNYYTFRGTLVIKFSVSTPSYSYGQILFSINQMDIERTFAGIPNADQPFHMSSRIHAVMEIGSPSTVTMRLPYSEQYHYYDVHSGVSFALVPTIDFSLLTPALLRADSGAATTGTITAQAWFEDITLSTPVPILFQSESTKASKGPISSVATVVARAANTLSSLPVIGPFAKAVEIGSSAVSSIAKIFGFSRPLDTDQHTTVGQTWGAVSIVNDQSRPLTLDPHQGVAINPDLWNTTVDPFAYSEIIGREGLVDIITIASTYNPNDYVLIVPVGPGLTNSTGQRYALTPLAFGSMPFAYWRGSIKYKFVFSASKYHRGKVRLFWCPDPSISLASLPNTNEIPSSSYNVDISIDCATTLELTVTWAQPLPYAIVGPMTVGVDQTTVPSAGAYSNGYLILQVVEPITAPVVNAPVYCSIWCSAGDDFELQVPTTETMNLYQRTAYVASTATTIPGVLLSNVASRAAGSITTIAGVTPAVKYGLAQSAPASSETNVAQAAATEVCFGNTHYDNNAAKIYMGEKFNSFRPLLQRKTLSRTLVVFPQVSYLYAFSIPYYPIEPAIVTNGAAVYNTWAQWTYLGWYSMLFRGVRGGIKVRIIPRRVGSEGRPPIRITSPHYDQWFSYSTPSDPVLSDSTNYSMSLINQDIGATEHFHPSVGQEISFIIPWQHTVDHYPTWLEPDLGEAVQYPGVRMLVDCGATASIQNDFELQYSAAEDFTATTWTGVPYLYSVVPNRFS